MTSKTFCVLPWTHLATLTDGTPTLCCVANNASSRLNLNEIGLKDAWNSDYWKQARLQMLRGDEVRACRRCYDEEKVGYRSHRVVENAVWERRLGADGVQKLIDATDATGAVSIGVRTVDLRLGNTCNLQCIMCQPRDSSKWLPLARKLKEEIENPDLKGEWTYKANIDPERFKWYREERVWQDLEEFLPYLEEIIVAGGEPMLIKQHADFVRRCVETGYAKNIWIRYHTNATMLPEELLPLWREFRHVEFFLSVDGPEWINDYIRYPAIWQDIEATMAKIDAMPDNISFKVLCSVHALSIFHIPELLDWLDAKQFRKWQARADLKWHIQPGIVQWPKYLDVQVLPSALKQLVTDKLSAFLQRHPLDKLDGILTYMNSQANEALLPQLREYLDALDRHRGTDFASVFGEISPFFWE